MYGTQKWGGGMRMKMFLLASAALLAFACGSPGLIGPPAATELAFSLKIAVEPDAMPGGGLQASSVATVGVKPTEGALWTITKATFIVRDETDQVLLQTSVNGPIAIPDGGVGEVRHQLSWDPAKGLGRSLEISVALMNSSGATTVLSSRLAF